MKRDPDPHYRHRFPAEIISHAVWLYSMFRLSFRDDVPRHERGGYERRVIQLIAPNSEEKR